MSDVQEERYESIKAVVDCGELTWRYQVSGCSPTQMAHDEDVSDWSDADIRSVTKSMLDVTDEELDEAGFVVEFH